MPRLAAGTAAGGNIPPVSVAEQGDGSLQRGPPCRHGGDRAKPKGPPEGSSETGGGPQVLGDQPRDRSGARGPSAQGPLQNPEDPEAAGEVTGKGITIPTQLRGKGDA